MFTRSRLAPRASSRLRRALVAVTLLSGLAASAGAATAFDVSGSVAAGGTRTHQLWVGMEDNRALVRGTRGLDIDCWVYDEDGDLVDSDTDTTPICLLDTPGFGAHRVVIRNYSGQRSSYVLYQAR